MSEPAEYGAEVVADDEFASADANPADAPVAPTALWRELLAALGLVAALDFSIFRGEGFAGYAMLLAVAPLLMLLGRSHLRTTPLRLIPLGLLLAGAAARDLWCGGILATGCGLLLIAAFSYQAAGRSPFVLETIAFAFQIVPSGIQRLFQHERVLADCRLRPSRVGLAALALPLIALAVFGSLFVLANPDLARVVHEGLFEWLERLRDWLISLRWWELAFCLAMFVVALGLLRPVHAFDPGQSEEAVRSASVPANAPLYEAIRNTLLAVIGLFAIYLVFEFGTLWFREFPQGFYYSGYAHEGAAWLTIALALATASLSVFFRNEILNDPRLPQLRRLATCWAVLNLLLAAAVYNRLWIYVSFNGMTRMRTIGFLGTTAVVGGILLVMMKIARNKNLLWLIRRQLWVLAAMIYIYAVFPVDRWITAYNVRQILAGRLAPSVQIAEHPNSAEGYLMLEPLLECQDATIREGIRALLAGLDERLNGKWLKGRSLRLSGSWQPFEFPSEYDRATPVPTSRSAYQIADELLAERLLQMQPRLEPYRSSPSQGTTAWRDFREYAYQWY